jgi:hypothetical protein
MRINYPSKLRQDHITAAKIAAARAVELSNQAAIEAAKTIANLINTTENYYKLLEGGQETYIKLSRRRIQALTSFDPIPIQSWSSHEWQLFNHPDQALITHACQNKKH